MNQPTPSTQYVALEGIQHGNRFLTSYIPGDDPTKSATGEIWYRILGYANTHAEAIRIIYPTQADQDKALRDYMYETLRKMAGLAPIG